MDKTDFQDFFNRNADKREKWNKRNWFYHRSQEKYFSFIIPEKSRVIEIGCGAGDLLHAMKPSYGVGIDFSPVIINIARNKYPNLTFHIVDAEDFNTDEIFDYIILSDLAGCLWDVQKVFNNIKSLCHRQTRLVLSNFNFFWEPVMILGEFFHFKLRQPKQNWLSTADLITLLYLEYYQVIAVHKKILFPIYVPVLGFLFNKRIANVPLLNSLNLVNIIVARPLFKEEMNYSVSIIIPAKNEKENIENAIIRTPSFGTEQEFIYVEGNSSDGTFNEILRVKEKYSTKNIKAIKQTGKGKGNAVREGFENATGDILFILDADLTTPPEDMPKFYEAIRKNKGEFINGCRLVYPMEKQAMRFLNLIANKTFGIIFSFLLGQPLKDTLCGTKVLYKNDYEKIKNNRKFFGDFDPFGDFDLLFGASKLNLKIVEIIVRYKDRQYGTTQISRFKHGWLLLRMTLFAARKLKFF